ncbi:MAG: MBL fold metallo-hydrolase [Spirochaetales bacterium]|uniref:MBL fold metallo-hydrolase n=1 Tax=Candidatus Thalassospirochaeta sargassi TaxID=3119039 RepID=A0AAJ1IHA2_9SPIO|nr:MBL fold metallo-hydrolase [Spirochaetales bacterium]
MNSNDVNGKVLFEADSHQFIWLGADEEEEQGVVQTNQYLIINNGRGTLVDPGGIHLFSRVVALVSRYIDLDKIDNIFFSHQDPDVSSGIALWLGVTGAKIYISELWIRFIPHFGIIDDSRIVGIEALNGSLKLSSGNELKLIPSHFLHSCGNYSFYDPISKTLFTGDIGAAVFPSNGQYLFVEDFNKHLEIMEGFHKRYMTSNVVIKKWLSKISNLDVKLIAPQHGALFKDENVDNFLNWFSELRCGIDIIDSIYV